MKRCLTVKTLAAVLTLALSLATVSESQAGKAPSQAKDIAASLAADLRSRTNASFDGLLKRWEKQHGIAAVSPLLNLATNTALADADRYIALMGAAKLGGRGAAPRMTGLLKDRSWMIRNGALRALGALGDSSTAPAVLALLKDPALVVRLEAVATVEKLRPTGAADALLAAIHDQENYRAGKALWVPNRALESLSRLGSRELAPRLLPLLEMNSDPRLQSDAIRALEKMTAKKLKANATLTERVRAWTSELKSSVSFRRTPS